MDRLDLAEAIMRTSTKEHPITSSELGRRLKIRFMNGNPGPRVVIDRLIFQRHMPIVSDSRGYYIATTKKDLTVYQQDIKTRIAGMRKRLAKIEANLQSQKAK